MTVPIIMTVRPSPARAARLIVALLAAGTLFPGPLAPGAAAQSSAGRIVCPLASAPSSCCPGPIVASAQVLPCCAVVTVGCCPVTPAARAIPAVCPAGLSIAARPSPGHAGENVTVSGRLGTGTVAGQTVILWERRAGQVNFGQVAHRRTGTTGSYSFRRRVATNVDWYATSGTLTSVTLTEPVRATVRLRASVRESGAHRQLLLSGTVAPSHAGERVVLQRRRGRSWMTIARPELDARSRFAFVQHPAAGVGERLRAVLNADARNARSVSAVLELSPR